MTARPPRGKRTSLDPSQLARKRAVDREAQRSIRDKNKARIAHLENLVQTLQASGGSHCPADEFATQANEKHEEINKLQRALKRIQRIANDLVQPSIENADNGRPPLASRKPFLATKRESQYCNGRPGNPRRDFSLSISGNDCVFGMDLSAGSTTCEDISRLGGSASSGTIGEGATIPDAQVFSTMETKANFAPRGARAMESPLEEIASSILGTSLLDGKLWYLAGTLLNRILSMPVELEHRLALNDDIAIRGVVEGWPSVMKRHNLDSGWQWLRLVDQSLYPFIETTERLAIIRMMRLQFEHQTQPHIGSSRPRPTFMVARPAQEYLEHDPLVETWVWPGLREYMLFSPRKYATDKFMDTFRQSFRFVWAAAPGDAYGLNSATGLYSFSEAFVERQNDLRCWTLRSNFFEVFPELRRDIPAFDPSPLSFLAGNSLGTARAISIATDEHDNSMFDFAVNDEAASDSGESMSDVCGVEGL